MAFVQRATKRHPGAIVSSSNSTPGDLLIWRTAWRDLSTDPQPLNDGETWTLILRENFERSTGGTNNCAVVVYAADCAVAQTTHNEQAATGGSANGTVISSVLDEWSGVTVADLVAIGVHDQVGTVLDIGALTRVEFALGVWGNGYDGFGTQTVTPGVWVHDFMASRDTTVAGDSGYLEAYPVGWFGHVIGDGSDVEATITINASQKWAGIAVTVPLPAQAGVYLDWQADGFDNGDYDNVTSDTASWTITRGVGPELTGGSQPGTCTLILNDPDGLYNPENASSPIHAYLRDGVPCWIGVNGSDGTVSGSGTSVRGRFAGRITDITPIPAGGADVPPQVEIQLSDALDGYSRAHVSVADSRTRSQADLRAAVLADAGETRVSLPDEPRGLPLSSADGFLLEVLNSINAANGTRHFIDPADNFTDWYTYTARNRNYKLTGSADASLAGTDHVDIAGWRKTADGIINQQRASITPVVFPDFREKVWEHEGILALPAITGGHATMTLWAEYDDFVDQAEIRYSGTYTPTVTFTPFGRSAKIVITAATSEPISLTSLYVTGLKVQRGVPLAIVEDDTTSQADPRGIRAGSEITGDLVGSIAAATGFAKHIVWRFGNPQYRPSMTVQNWIPDMFDWDLFDVLAFSSTQIAVTDRLFEIVGLTETCEVAASTPTVVVHHTSTYVLQESRVQTPTTWFTWDSSVWDGADTWAYL